MQKKISTKRSLAMAAFFIALNLCRPSMLHAAGNAGLSPAIVLLNGITVSPGHNRVFLQISFSNSSPENISLVEGQTFRGVKLLAVDFASASIRIENSGKIQTIKICDTPNLLAASAENNSGSIASVQSVSERGGDSAAPGSNGATPGGSLLQPEAMEISAGKTDNSNSRAGNTSSGGSNSGDSAAANVPGSHVYYWWLQDAKDIEQTRLTTAQSVLAGDMAPQPLTPLTPPLTPAVLIGPDSVYMEHGPGVLISDKGVVLGVAKPAGN
jgi:hypothetical protein